MSLIAGLKAIVMWFPPERVALANGWYIMLGALGALSATGAAEFVVQGVGWRGLFAIVAAALATVALIILLAVPEKKQAQPSGSSPKVSFSTVFGDTRCGGSCHLNRRIDDLIRGSGFHLAALSTGYAPGPRAMMYMYQGVAT